MRFQFLQNAILSHDAMPYSDVLSEINVVGTPESYQLLNVLDFTSDRKRMSVILRNTQTGIVRPISQTSSNRSLDHSLDEGCR